MRLLPVKVASTSPLTVTFPDGASVRARGAAGSTFSTSTGSYLAVYQPGSMPLVFQVS